MSTSAGKRSSELLQSDEDDASSHGMQVKQSLAARPPVTDKLLSVSRRLRGLASGLDQVTIVDATPADQSRAKALIPNSPAWSMFSTALPALEVPRMALARPTTRTKCSTRLMDKEAISNLAPQDPPTSLTRS